MTTYVAVLKGSDVELARSSKTESVEGNTYFPASDIADVFSDSPTPYTCPWKGKAQYHNLVKGADVNDIAWSYPEAKEAAKHIKGHYAFDKSKVEVKAI